MTAGHDFIDPGPHAAWLRNEPLTLTRQEFDLLPSAIETVRQAE